MQEIACPYCNSKDIKKAGKRKDRFGNIQKYLCKDCNRYFSEDRLKFTQFPAKIVLNAISLYNLGYSQEKVSQLIANRYKIQPPRNTISQWINKYSIPCTYYTLRKQALKLYRPKNIILDEKLQHKQVYNFKLHKAKIVLLEKKKVLPEEKLKALKTYLENVPANKTGAIPFPHHIFTIAPNNTQQESRASKLSMRLFKITQKTKHNYANKLAGLGLKLAPDNKARHQAVQDFMLINDSTTVATEVPVYLTDSDIAYFKNKGFGFSFEACKTPITGHIDILQIRNGLIYILDYKPEAHKINPIKQLTIYALALAARTKIPVKDFKCAWFDDRNYYEFFPLKAVYEKRS